MKGLSKLYIFVIVVSFLASGKSLLSSSSVVIATGSGSTKGSSFFPLFSSHHCISRTVVKKGHCDNECGSRSSGTQGRLLSVPSHLRAGGSSSSTMEPSSNSGFPEKVSRAKRIKDWSNKNFFLLGMVAAVGMAKLFPKLGTNGGLLRPELFIGRFGVTMVFLISGLSLELRQLGKAASNFKLNSLIQSASFVAWPFLVGWPLTSALSKLGPSFFPQSLLDGILILTCLPTTVNMCVILTTTAGGNVAAALWNAVISNLGGIFFTPALLFYFFGAQIQLPFIEMFVKLCNKVLLPVAIGQALRFTIVKKLYEARSKTFKRASEVILLSILWNAFCTAFTEGIGLDLRSTGMLLILLPILHLLSLGTLFRFFSLPLLTFSRGDIVAAMFCASQKTLAFGLPLINTIFEGNPNLAAYCAPLMFIHPIQLIIGSLLIPRLEKYTSEDLKHSAG